MYDHNRYSFSVEQPEEIKKTKKPRRGGLAAIIISIALASGAVGGTSGYIFNNLNNNTEAPVTTVQNDNITTVAKNQDSLSLEEIYSTCNPSVVAISTELVSQNIFGQSSNSASAGSGFVISDNGYIATNYHVIESATKIMVMMSDGKEYEAKLIGGDQSNDIAVLKIEATGLKYLTFGDSDALNVGNQVAAIGNPLGELANTFTVGYISAKERSINIDGNPILMLQSDVSISPGNSGGPLIDSYGNVIGIVSAKSSGSGVEGLGFAIPSNIASGLIQEIIDNGYVTGRPSIGISIQEIDDQTASYYHTTAGLYVAAVEEGSAADKAGLKEGDRIVKLGEKEIMTFAELKEAKLKNKAGDTVKIIIEREGEKLDLSITFDEEQPE